MLRSLTTHMATWRFEGAPEFRGALVNTSLTGRFPALSPETICQALLAQEPPRPEPEASLAQGPERRVPLRPGVAPTD